MALAVLDYVLNYGTATVAIDPARMHVTGCSSEGATTSRMACHTDGRCGSGTDQAGQVADCAARAADVDLSPHGPADPLLLVGGSPGGMGRPPTEQALAGWHAG